MPKPKAKPAEVEPDDSEEFGRRALRVLFWDIEVTPYTAYSWGPSWETRLIEIVEQSRVLCFSAKWMGGEHITKGWPDYPGYKPGRGDDKRICRDIRELLDAADVVIGQNSRQFDHKVLNARMARHNIPPPSPYKTIDTRNAARQSMRLPSNKLDDIGSYFGLGRKETHEGFALWVGCIAGDMKAWAKMKRYNKRDVELLERVYLKLRPWMKTHPTMGVRRDGPVCPRCGSKETHKRGTSISTTMTYQRYQCISCGGWAKYPLAKPRTGRPLVVEG